jgi:hypothetical protein
MGEHVSIEQQHFVRIDVAGWIPPSAPAANTPT